MLFLFHTASAFNSIYTIFNRQLGVSPKRGFGKTRAKFKVCYSNGHKLKHWCLSVVLLKKMPLLYVEQMVRSKTGKILLERVLTSYPAVYWPPHHSHSLYKAGWPGPHKSVWTTPSSKKQTNKKPTETTQITCYVCHTQIWTNDNLFTNKKSLYKKF